MAADKDLEKVKQPIETDGYKIGPQLLAGFLVNLTMFFSGCTFSWPAPSLPKLLDEHSDLRLTSDQGGWVVSASAMGACIGPIISAFLINRVGRKWFLHFTGIPYLLSWILIFLATSYEHLLLARFIGGVGIGFSFGGTPIYLGEIAETRIRGALGSMCTLFTFGGTLMTYSIGPWVDRKTLATINMGITAAYLVLFPWMPETPYFYLRKGDAKSAEKSLSWLRGTKSVHTELKEMTNLIEVEMSQEGNIDELITVPANRKSNGLIMILLAAQQLSGMTVLLSYITIFFQRTSLNINANVASIIMGAISLVSNLFATLVIDKVGRKILFLVSLSGSTLCLFSIATYFYLGTSGVNVELLSWTPLVAAVSLSVFFALGLGPIPYAVLSEIYPTTVKAWATTIASIYGSILSVIVTKLYQVVVDQWGDHVIFYGFCCCELVLLVLAFLKLPETKGKSFAEIQSILRGDNKPSHTMTDKLTEDARC